MKTTLPEQIAELNRELTVRKALYPNWIIVGKISKQVAEHRLAVLEDLITELKNKYGTQKKLF